MNDELMEFPSLLSLSSSLNGSLCLGEIPVAVPIPGGPNSAPNGIRLQDPSPVMVETRSGDLRRLEERFTTAIDEFSDSDGTRNSTMKMSIQNPSVDLLRVEDTFRKAMGDLFSRLDESIRRRYQADRRCDRTLKELRDDFSALDVQNNALMAKLKAGNGGNSAAASIGLNVRSHCFATHQSEPRDKSVEECIPRFPAEISNFIASKFSNPMVELRSLKQVGMVSDYITHFKTLLEKMEINESYAVHLFVSGLNSHVQKSVKMFEPKSLVHAFALARLQESALNFRGNYCENENRKEDSVRESILTNLEFDEERSSGKEVCVEKNGGKDLTKRRALVADASDLRFKELSAGVLALQMQQNELMNRFVATRGGGAPGGAPPRAPYFATRQTKVGFPIFSGEDLAGWVIRCDHFFAINLTLEDSKVRLAVINFEGCALQWFQLWSQYQDNAMATPWILLLQELEGCFGDKKVTTGDAENLGGSIVNNSPLLPTHIIQSRRLLTPEKMGCDEKLKQRYRLELEEDVIEGKTSEYGKATEEGNIGDEAMEDDNSLFSINAISGFTTKIKSEMMDVAERCEAICTATAFTTDVLLLPMGNYDMVLRVQWPETLGDIQWNFKNLTKDFMLEGTRYELSKGQNEQKISTVTENELLTQCNGVQLGYFQVNEEGKSELWAMVNSGILTTYQRISPLFF